MILLQGTEKQVKWAAAIRDDVLQRCETVIRLVCGETTTGLSTWETHLYNAQAKQVAEEISADREVLQVYLEALRSQQEARWWIDRRGLSVAAWLVDVQADLLSVRRPSPEEHHLEAEAQAEATVVPTYPKTRLVAEIRMVDQSVEVVYPERWETFQELVRALHYTWSGRCWRRPVSVLYGSVADRAAELGHRLLAAGIPIRVYDAEVREMAAAGQYVPEPVRWVKRVMTGPHAGWFKIFWPKDEDWYTAAKRISRSQYEKGGIAVPPESMDEVLDFADMYQFALSPGARRLVVEVQAARKHALTADVSPPKKQRVKRNDRPVAVAVPEEVGIPADLRDEDVSDDDTSA